MIDKFYPKVTIVIPVYNGANFLEEAINSALQQTYENIEIIVVNDGSNDDGKTEQIALKYKDQIQYFAKTNGGVATALNLAIKKMSGEYFSWLSHDDLYYSDKIEYQINFLASLNDRDIVLYGDVELIDEHGKMVQVVLYDHELLSKKPLYSVLRGGISGCTLLIPKTQLLRFNGFDESLKTTQDYDLWFKIAQTCRFIHMNKILVKSRIHPHQTANQMPLVNRAECERLWYNIVSNTNQNTILSYGESLSDFYYTQALFTLKHRFLDASLYCINKLPWYRWMSLFPFYFMYSSKRKVMSFIKRSWRSLA